MTILGILLYGLLMGVSLGMTLALIAVQAGRKRWPYMFLNIEERQGGIVCEVLKGREQTDRKTGHKNFVLKQTILGSGIGAFRSKLILTQMPDKALTLIRKSGGVLAITFSPAENIYMPIAILKDEENIKMIVRDTDARNWYKYTLESIMKAKLLNPKTSLQEKAPALIIAAGVICIILLIIGGTVILPFITQQNAQLASTVANVIDQFNQLGVGIGHAASGAQVWG